MTEERQQYSSKVDIREVLATDEGDSLPIQKCDASTAPGGEASYRPLERTAGHLVVFLTIGMFVSLVRVSLCVLLNLFFPMQRASDNYMMVRAVNDWCISACGIAVFSICAVLFCRWVHWAFSNLVYFQGAAPMITPKQSVACWFIPIVNLWAPREAIDYLWKESQPLPTPGSKRIPILFEVWWIVWLANLIANGLWLESYFSQIGVPYNLNASALSGATAFASAYLFIRVVTAITECQHKKMHVMTAASDKKD